ncbi:MAG: hypothetical protein PVF89_02525 [Lysobacterales bacterium]|jgi:hypothetical protein
MPVKTSYILPLLLLTCACSGPQQRPEPSDYLATKIDSDGTKEFYYTITLANPPRPTPAPPRPVSGGAQVTGGSSGHLYGGIGISVAAPVGQQRRGSGYVDEAFIREHLEKKLLTTGYCREGWLERDRNVRPPDLSIHGVCKENATARDRQQFPNNTDSG